MDPLTILKSIIVMLQGEDDPGHIAAGFALGAIFGLLPKSNLFAAFFLLLFFFFRAEKGAALISALFFTPLGYLLDPVAHRIGYVLLTLGPLRGLWTWLYNMPIVPWTKFNNTVVLGNLALGLLFYYPVYEAALKGVARYRARWKRHVDGLRVVKAIKGTYLVRTLVKIQGGLKP